MPVRPGIDLPEDYREIVGADAASVFHSVLGYSLADYVRESEKPNSVVIVRLAGSAIVGILWLETRDDHLMIEHIARDDRNSWPGLGAEMLFLAERIAVKLGFPEVRLESLAEPKLTSWYESMGYKKSGDIVELAGWTLQPMSKRVV